MIMISMSHVFASLLGSLNDAIWKVLKQQHGDKNACKTSSHKEIDTTYGFILCSVQHILNCTQFTKECVIYLLCILRVEIYECSTTYFCNPVTLIALIRSVQVKLSDQYTYASLTPNESDFTVTDNFQCWNKIMRVFLELGHTPVISIIRCKVIKTAVLTF